MPMRSRTGSPGRCKELILISGAARKTFFAVGSHPVRALRVCEAGSILHTLSGMLAASTAGAELRRRHRANGSSRRARRRTCARRSETLRDASIELQPRRIPVKAEIGARIDLKIRRQRILKRCVQRADRRSQPVGSDG